MPSSEWKKSGHTRTIVRRDHALIAPDSHVPAPLPSWDGASGVILLAPGLGARLAQSLVLLEAGQRAPLRPSSHLERLVYVLEGELDWETPLRVGSFVFVPPGEEVAPFRAQSEARLLVFEKRYAPREGVELPPRVVGHESECEGQPFLGDPDARLQTLLPLDASFDMAVNVFTYQPGATLPFVETHIMEHGLLMLDGGGIYRLGDHWYPVAAGDAIWMAPFCPQWFAATGKVPARYIYYKDVNRDAL